MAQPDSAVDLAGVAAAPAAAKARSGGVQSIERAFAILEILVANGGSMGLSALAAAADLPLPTIHRLARTLVDLGYLRQEPSRQYTLGPRVLLLAESSSTMLNSLAQPHLLRLVDEIGETANLASLDGDQIVYIAQVPSRHSMRMFTEVGRRVDPHCTAVGKAIMARMPRERARALLTRTGMAPRTPHTLTDLEELCDGLDEIERLGYAMDEEEQEVGVRCVAVVVPTEEPRVAISVSGPAPRMTDALVGDAVPLLRRTAQELATALI